MKARLLLPLGAVVAVLALVLLAGGYDVARAGTFNPELKIDLKDNTPGASSDFTVQFGVPKDNVNFAGVVAFIPTDWGIVAGNAIKDGTPVGMLTADATLGLVNGSCSQDVPVEFKMYDSSLDESETVSFEDTDNNHTRDFAEAKIDPEKIIPDAIYKYPEFIPRIFDAGQKPVRRSAGVSIVAGTPVLLQFLIFAPGTKISDNIPHDKNLGFPSVTLLQNIGDPDVKPAPGVITDFCAPLTSNNDSVGTAEDGTKLYVNPQNGEYTFTVISAGQRDADSDGYENSLDTCPFDTNIGNPRIPNSGDLDSDGLDAACDPNDNPITGGTNSDEDGDGYLNRQDNCPLIANGELNTDNQGDNDKGTNGTKSPDQIGDACDQNPDTPDGELLIETREFKVKIGDGTGPGGPPTNCPDCLSPEGGNNPTPAPTTAKDDGGSSSTGLIVGIIVAVIAAAVVIGGGAAFMARRRGGGGGA